MPAVYCGTKRCYYEDILSPPPRKRFRCYSPSWSSPSSSLDQLRIAFPNLELTVLVKALEEHGNDLNKSLYSLISSEEKKKAKELAARGVNDKTAGETFTTSSHNLPKNGDEWVELLVREVLQSNGIDDAKVRATTVLEVLEKTLSERTREELGKKFQEENVAVHQQLIKDNTVLKRAVAIQHERLKAFDEVNQQLQVLKQLVPQYQEKLRNLEVNNYALKMQLQQLEHGNSIPTRFNPEVF